MHIKESFKLIMRRLISKNPKLKSKSKSRKLPKQHASQHGRGEGSAAEHPILSEDRGKAPTDLDLGLWKLLATTTSLYPDREALVSLWQPASLNQPAGPPLHPPQASTTPSDTPSATRKSSSDCLRWTYRDLHDKAERLAHILESQHGCRPGMHLAVILWNCAEWGLFFWAAAKIGMTFVPIDPRAMDDVPHMLEAVGPKVLVVQDAEAVTSLPACCPGALITEASASILRIHCSAGEVPGWLSLSSIFSPDHLAQGDTAARNKLNSGGSRSLSAPAAAGLVVFTSGTTARPKGCPHTARNLVSQTSTYDPHPHHGAEEGHENQPDRWLVHTPVAHIFAINNTFRAWRLGDTVVFPSRTFSVDSTARALVQERCTIMSATPTLVKALMLHRDVPSPRELQAHLTLVTIAGTMIGAEDIRLCREGLGARDAIQAFGMSEGAPLISWSRQDAMLVEGYHPGVGKALPGTWIRICKPGTRAVIPRTQVGELHVGGPSVISRYLGEVEADKFYDDKGERWLKTGDQAVMTEKGVVHILGRYKDLIIRGGENINPALIEKVLNEYFPGLDAQVVGAQDDMAGQVPVAVIKPLSKGISKADLIERASLLGQRYTLAAIYTLQELGIEKMPCTPLGKPKKVVLASLVAERRAADSKKINTAAVEQAQSDLEEKLLASWEQVAGIRPEKEDSVLFFADSITLLRYCDAVLRSCGRQIYLEDFQRGDTVEKLARLLLATHRNSGPRCREKASNGVEKQSGPRVTFADKPRFMGSDMVDERGLWKAAQTRIKSMGLCHAKVEDVIPIRHSLHRMVLGQRPQSYHVRIVFRVKKPSSQEQIYHGLSRALSSRPMLRTVVVKAQGQLYHAVISIHEELLRKLVRTVEVPTEDKARKLYENSSTESHPQGFMFGAIIIKIDETGQHMLVLTYNHAVIDALTLLPWHRDLDRLISNRDAEIPSLTPYELFADLFFRYQDSASARKAISFHARRLRGISRCRNSLWPPQRAPGFFISHDLNTRSSEQRRAFRNKVWDGEWEASASAFCFPRRSRIVQLPNLPKLQDAHGVEPSLFTMCALAIFNMLQTRTSCAVFNSWEGGRSWPFIPPWVESSLPPATSIDGPTFQWILNMFEVRGAESVADFFRRMQFEREQVLRHVHAPWEGILADLKEEAELANDASFRQSFVWDVSMGIAASRGFVNDFERLQPVSRYDWPDSGFFWNAFMIDTMSLFFIASWDTAQMNVAEVESHCDGLTAVMRMLAKEDNWEKKMGEVFRMGRC